MDKNELLEKIAEYSLVVRKKSGAELGGGIAINPKNVISAFHRIHPRLTPQEIYMGLEELAKDGTLEVIYFLPRGKIPEEYI